MKVIMMLNRLYGQKDFQYSKLEWFAILYCILNKGEIFNRDDILSTSLQAQVKNAHNFLTTFAQDFQMTSYLVNAICAFTPFSIDGLEF